MKLEELTGLTPEQKIKALIIYDAYGYGDADITSIGIKSAEELEDLYDELKDSDDFGNAMYNAMQELRSSGIETGLIPAINSRHYEIDSNAVKALDGSWVEFPYIHGGGKHSNPEECDWMDYARDIICTEEEKVVLVRTFSIKDNNS